VSILKSHFDRNLFGALCYLASAPAADPASDASPSSAGPTTPSGPTAASASAPPESPYRGGERQGTRGMGEVQVHLSKNTFRGSGGMQGAGGVVGKVAGIAVLARHNVYVDDAGFRSSD